MPHLTIEYSANLPHYPEAETLTALNAALCAHPQVQDEADLKTRFIVADSFEIGIAPANRAFVHAQLRLLAGRTPEAKKELSDRIAAVLRERTPKPQGVMVQLSVEIVDMDRGSYVKERLCTGHEPGARLATDGALAPSHASSVAASQPRRLLMNAQPCTRGMSATRSTASTT